MNIRDQKRAAELTECLELFRSKVISLPGINHAADRDSLVRQLIDSERRIRFVHTVRDRLHDAVVADPSHDAFDPIKAAAHYRQQSNIEEACWLVFLSTHFGKHRVCGWRLMKDVYGALHRQPVWTWSTVIQDPTELTKWLTANFLPLTTDGTTRHFGNHRKYESIRPSSNKSTGYVIESYVNWIQTSGSHEQLFDAALSASNGDPRLAFGRIYQSMKVLRFGRTAKFDYLTMLAKLSLANIEADSAYISTSTGPKKGAKLLFGGDLASAKFTDRELDKYAILFANALGVGLQEVEDALCNWQKSPEKYCRFVG